MKPLTILNIEKIFIPVFIFSFTLAIYILTLSRSIYFGDSGEFITVAKTLGIPHPPGYPLYTMLAHLFTYLPFGNLAFRVNLFSAVTSSLTVVVVYFICLKLTKNRIASASASLFLAFSYLFWLYSLVAEVFSLNNLFVALIVLFSLHIFEKPHEKKLFYLLAFVFGLALTNHHTILFLTPALLFLVLATNSKLLTQPKFIILNTLFLIIGLLPYIYLPARASQNPVLTWGDPDSLGEFLNHVLRRDYGTFILSPLAGQKFLNLALAGFYLKSFVRSFTIVGLVLGLLGSWLLFTNHRKVFWLIILAFLFVGPIFIILTRSQVNPIQNGITERFFIASHLIFAVLIGFGLANIPVAIQKLPVAGYLPYLFFLIPLILNFPKIDQSKNFLYEEYGQKMFETLPKDSLLITATDQTFMISTYLQMAQNRRPDLKIINFTLLPADWYKENLRQRYKDLNLPWEKFNRQISGAQAEAIICQEVVPKYSVFNYSSRWQTQFPRKNQPCPLLPSFLLVRQVPKDEKNKAEDLQSQLAFWQKVNKELEGINPPDYRTQAILYSYSDAQTFLGLSLSEAGFENEAFEIYQNAFRLSPLNGVAPQLIAQKYIEAKNFDKAIEWQQKALSTDPTLAFPHKILGQIYLDEKNDKKKAILHFQKYLSLAPNAQDRDQIQKIIEKLR